MARVSFSDAHDESSTTGSFFKLEDKGVARVQFLISDPNDIPTYYTHHIDVPGFEWGKDVQCNMDDYEDGECELCKAGIARKTAAIIIMYDLDSKEIKLWQRSKKWVSDKIIPLLNRYGDLSKLVVEIERHGVKKDTSYTLFPMPNDAADDVSALQIPDDFDFMLWKKSNDDMFTYLNTGNFPSNDSDSDDEEPIVRRRTSSDDEPRSRRTEGAYRRRG